MSDHTAEKLLREMHERADAEKAELLTRAESKVSEIEEQADRECRRIEEQAVAELESELKSERDRVLGEARREMREVRLQIKHSASEAVFADARAELEARIGGDGYRKVLAVLIREALAFVGEGAIAKVADDELALCREVVADASLACTVRGGGGRGRLTLTSPDGRRRVENGIAGRLQRAEEKLSAEVARVLFG